MAAPVWGQKKVISVSGRGRWPPGRRRAWPALAWCSPCGTQPSTGWHPEVAGSLAGDGPTPALEPAGRGRSRICRWILAGAVLELQGDQHPGRSPPRSRRPPAQLLPGGGRAVHACSGHPAPLHTGFRLVHQAGVLLGELLAGVDDALHGVAGVRDPGGDLAVSARTGRQAPHFLSDHRGPAFLASTGGFDGPR